MINFNLCLLITSAAKLQQLKGLESRRLNTTMITSCQRRGRLNLRSRAVQNLRILKDRGLNKCLSFNSINLRLVIGKGLSQQQFHTLSSCSGTTPLSKHVIIERSFCSSSEKPSSKTVKTKVHTEDDKNKGDKHKPLLISHSNATRVKNDKIRQTQQQGEDDRQQNDAMVATSVSGLYY